MKLLDEEASREFNTFLFQCLQDTLAKVLGEEVAEALLKRLEKDTDPEREELINQPDILHSSLERILGTAATAIEKMIAKSIHNKLHMNQPAQSLEATIRQAIQIYIKQEHASPLQTQSYMRKESESTPRNILLHST